MGAARARRLRAEKLVAEATDAFVAHENERALELLREAFGIWPKLAVAEELAALWESQP